MKKRIAVTTALILALTVPSAFSAGQYSPVFDKVNSPQDVKKLNTSEMNILAKDIRTAILNKVNTAGGHLGPDLGIVETIIALHYVFNSPQDKIVYDVSHQIYPQDVKMLLLIRLRILRLQDILILTRARMTILF